VAPELTRPAHARLDLVHHQERVVLGGDGGIERGCGWLWVQRRGGYDNKEAVLENERSGGAEGSVGGRRGQWGDGGRGSVAKAHAWGKRALLLCFKGAE
jgi:hypothetical protein